MRTVVAIVFLMQSSAVMAYSQSPGDDRELFDVTFWSKKLRLSQMQLFQLHSINRDMYCALNELANTEDIESSDLRLIIQLWKTAMIEVLSDRQKRKWEKLKLRYMPGSG
jgi:hypothetical protein